MIKIENLTKMYNKSAKVAVDNLSLEIKQGEIFGFLGPNGAGKSTTIKCITGILPFSSGNINICGHDLKDDPIEAKRCIGYVPDNHATYEKLKGIEYLNFMADIYGVSQADRKLRIDKLIDMFELKDAVNNQINTYSHGMKQKICVIGAVLHNPKVWILDEPLTGLDPKSAKELKELMRAHCNEGNTVFFSSHVLEVVEKLCDRVGIISGGKLIAVCTMAELREKRSDLSLEDFFLSITEGMVLPKGNEKNNQNENFDKENGIGPSKTSSFGNKAILSNESSNIKERDIENSDSKNLGDDKVNLVSSPAIKRQKDTNIDNNFAFKAAEVRKNSEIKSQENKQKNADKSGKKEE